MKAILQKLASLARLVKIEHSIFALPFAYIGFFLAKRGWPGWGPFLLLALAMVAVRSYAMALNRLLDLPFDRENPRTQGRELVTGEVSRGAAWLFVVLCAALFVLACAGMNTLCLRLAPLVLFWAGFYSLTKRFTWMCHFFLGSVLGLAPVAGWLCLVPEFNLAPVLFGLGVTFWVAGFDMLYACQDVQFDRARGLHSAPARFGVGPALAMSSFCHLNTAIFFALAGWASGLGGIYFALLGLVVLILWLEHLLISESDLSRVNLAFFTFNGVVAIFVFAGVLCELIL